MKYDLEHPSPKEYAAGILCMLLASFFLAVTGAFAKKATEELDAVLVAFYQFVISTLITAPFVFRRGLELLKTKHPTLHLIRDISGLLAFYCLYLSLSSITLVDAIVLNNTTPLFVPLVILIWFRTRLHAGLWLSLLIGFIGIILILQPGGKDFIKLGSILALISGITAAVTLVTMRRLIATDKAELIAFYYFVFCVVGFAIITSLFYKWHWPTKTQWLPILGMGVSLPLMQYFAALATHYVTAQRIVPFLYTSIIFSGLIGWWFWNEIPTWLTILGIVLVILGACLSIFVGKAPKVPQDDSKTSSSKKP